ncbi:MAG TPA: hypothetical protein VJT83_09655 [Chitinophagaceae bacterium]|nr:hypothetical protein [Chitinophagaceae bacterium]
MHNNDFENKVQQKMHDLRFAPSDEVWMRVEAGIENKKRKRRFAFWMFLPLIVGGAAILFMKGERSKVKEEIVKVANYSAPLAVKKEEVKGVKEVKGIKGAKEKIKEKVIEENKEVGNYLAPLAVKNVEPIKEIIEENKEETKDSAPSAVKKEEPKLEHSPQIEGSKKSKSTSKSKWHFGFEASAGISSFSKGILQGNASTAGYYYDPLAYSNIPSIIYKPSDIKPGLAFSAGIYARRSISKKLDIRMCLSYLHASTSMKIGQRIDSVRAVNQSSMSMDKVDGYYTVGNSNSYTNKYNLIGLSASLDWHINRRIAWQNGLHFARLVNSNALHFDGLTGSYYENDRLFNKNQVLASSSIQFNLVNKISVGPEIKFALTDMLKSNANDKKHMRYFGLKGIYTLK